MKEHIKGDNRGGVKYAKSMHVAKKKKKSIIKEDFFPCFSSITWLQNSKCKGHSKKLHVLIVPTY